MSSSLPTFTPETGILTVEDFLLKLSNADLPMVSTSKGVWYYNVPAAFDIEVSSFYQYGEKKATMYIWQFGILNWVVTGRTWVQLTKLLMVIRKLLCIDDNRRLVVYVHNLAYEFQFMRKQFTWDKTFFLEPRKPVYCLTDGIEFRCSLKLSGKSLANVGKDLHKYKVSKLVGDLDYSLIRTSRTPLTEKEKSYCENDIRVLLSYIMEKIEQDGDITRIPLTNTGYVRDYCRKRCFRYYSRYRKLMSELTLDPDEYGQLKRGFGGGFTHANSHYVGENLEGLGSFDFTSSYPAAMLSEQYPMSKARKVESIESDEELEFYLKNYCCLFDVTFTNLVPKIHSDHPLSLSKCRDVADYVADNGRIVSSTKLTTTVTEQDFYTYSAFYEWDTLEIKEFRYYVKGYLPKPLAMSIIDLYERKTTLKDVPDEFVNYMLSKGMLNACYGMTVTDIVRDEISYDGENYHSEEPDLRTAIDKYNKGSKRFLFYPWGVWVTAYARANLFSGILACGDDYVYSDTDSIKILNPESHMDYIESYNVSITTKLSKAANFYGINPKVFSPLNRKGKPKPLGVWDYEGKLDKFKTLGAKRYIYQQGGHWNLTVAGVNKTKARDYLVENFADPRDGLTDKLVVPKEYSGRLTLTYLDDGCEGVVTDYLGNVGEFSELSCVHMEPSEYELTISDEFKQFLQLVKGAKEITW